MSKKLKLDALDVYSSDVERVSNAIKRVIKYSNSEDKLFSCFDYFRDHAAFKDRTLWDQNFGHFVNREFGRMHISHDMVTALRTRLENDIESFRSQHPDELTGLSDFIQKVQRASRIDEFTAYANVVEAGHDEVVVLGKTLGSLWMHQERHLEVMRDESGNACLTKMDVRDRVIELTRYKESRGKWLDLQERQSILKAQLEAPATYETVIGGQESTMFGPEDSVEDD